MFPTRPGDISHELLLTELAERYHEHTWSLLRHRNGVGEPLTAEQHTTHTLAALAYGHELAERATAARWSLAADALAAGAGVDATGAAMGTHPDDLPVFLAAWAAQQRRLGLMTDARHQQVLALIRVEVQ